ncbi:MAG: KEOPS complex subunit Cgi121 [Thermoplasmata archaeon]
MTVMGVRGSIPDLDGFLASVSALEKRHGITIQLLRADRIFGAEHLVSATEKAERAFAGKTNMSRTLGMEILLYAAAERQTGEALRKLGISDGIEEIALVLVGDVEPGKILEELALERDDSVLEPDCKDFSIFNITEADIEMFGVQGIPELVLEKVALSEVER